MRIWKKNINNLFNQNKITFMQLTGTHFNYYLVCHTKLWYFAHHLHMEQGSDDVLMGSVIHESSYGRERKEIAIDNSIVIDFIDNHKVIVEVKKSPKLEEAHRIQILYYLYYLKNEKGVEGITGEIRYPTIKNPLIKNQRIRYYVSGKILRRLFKVQSLLKL